MARATPARRAALAVLGDVRRKDARARDLLRTSSRLDGLDPRDRAFASRLTLGVTATWGHLDHVFGHYLKGRARLEPQVRDALRLATYELLFLSTPQEAAVSQGVELVRSARPRAAGLANAVLRRVGEKDVPRRAVALRSVELDDGWGAEDLVCVSGYPAWIVERVAQDRGRQAARAFCLASLEPAPVYVAANFAKHTTVEVEHLLCEAGLAPVSVPALDGVDGSFALAHPQVLSTSGLVEGVDVVVSDLSAQRVARLAAPKPGTSMLEVGQGRGTKSLLFQNAARANGRSARIVGLDVEAFKTKVSSARMRRAGLADCVRCVTCDARVLGTDREPADLRDTFDSVFVDAPCSGTGTLRRHPEIAWSLGENALDPDAADGLCALQLSILSAAATKVEDGGLLHYATCSVLRPENEGVVERFLRSAPGASFTLEADPLQTLPETGGPDGHFIATFRRDRR